MELDDKFFYEWKANEKSVEMLKEKNDQESG